MFKNVQGAQRMFKECSKSVQRVFKECSKSVQRVFKENHNKINNPILFVTDLSHLSLSLMNLRNCFGGKHRPAGKKI